MKNENSKTNTKIQTNSLKIQTTQYVSSSVSSSKIIDHYEYCIGKVLKRKYEVNILIK